jgi:hypothetical protein
MPDASHFEELAGRLRGLLIAVADQLPPITVGIVDELIHANEPAVALEIVSDMLVEAGARINKEILVDVERLAQAMNLEKTIVDRLRPLVDSTRSMHR